MHTSSLRPLFEPRNIAVIGASRTPGTIGWQLLDNLVRHGFRGALYPVNPGARAVHSFPVWRSVREIPVEIDLAVIAVPAVSVSAVVDECARKGVPTLIVISSGFREAGEEGAAREAALVERIRRYGMRLVGPNCMGVLTTDPEVSMNATFAPTMPPPGPISFLSQSGALGVTILDYAAEYGIGIRHFVSVGNRPDVSGNDLLEYWETDAATRVVLMYLETFGNPRRFTRIARRVARRKPIVVVRTGRSVPTRRRAAWSRTASLTGTDAAADALLAQCGVHRAETVEELFDLAMAFGGLQPPRSNRVGIVTNAGGPGAILADACEAEGLAVAELAPATREALRSLLGAEGGVRNPVHMDPSTTPERYEQALGIVLADRAVDAGIAAFVPPPGASQEVLAESVARVAREHPDVPLLAVLMGRDGLPEGRAQLQSAGVPGYIFPESAVRALAALHRHGRWLERPVQAPTTFDVDTDRVDQILAGALADGRTTLEEREGYGVLEAYGIPTAPWRVATTLEEATAAAGALGYPVVLRALAPRLGYRPERESAVLGIRDIAGLEEAYRTLEERLAAEDPGDSSAGFLVLPYYEEGRELIVGMTTDPTFGPVLMFGLGGIHAETLRDVAFRIPPLTEIEAREMVRSIRSFPLLEEGGRGAPVRIEAIVETLQRLSQLVQDHPSIAEIDLNPLLASETGVRALDVRVGLEPGAAGRVP